MGTLLGVHPIVPWHDGRIHGTRRYYLCLYFGQLIVYGKLVYRYINISSSHGSYGFYCHWRRTSSHWRIHTYIIIYIIYIQSPEVSFPPFKSFPIFFWLNKFTPPKKTFPKDHWTLQRKGLNLYSRGVLVLKMTPGLWGVRILREAHLFSKDS